MWAGIRERHVIHLATVAFALAGLTRFALHPQQMPLMSNVVYDLGIGPITILSSDDLLPTAGRLFWFVVTFLGFVGAVVIAQVTMVAMARALKLIPFPEEKKAWLVMVLASGLIYSAPVVLLTMRGHTLDRYLLFLVPVGISIIIHLGISTPLGRAGYITLPFALGSLILFGLFSVAGTHDYLSWNRARWLALNNLMAEQRVPADNIRGGFEFLGWYLYNSGHLDTDEDRYWDQWGDEYKVTLGLAPGYTEFKRYQFRRWLPPGKGYILVLRKTKPVTLR